MLLHCLHGNGIGVVDQFQVIMTHERQGGEPKESVEDIDFISGSVADSAVVCVLAIEDVGLESVEVDPLLALDHVARRKDPPTITNIGKLFRSTVETS